VTASERQILGSYAQARVGMGVQAEPEKSLVKFRLTPTLFVVLGSASTRTSNLPSRSFPVTLSSRLRFMCLRVATTPTGLVQDDVFKLLALWVTYYYNTTKVEVYPWVWAPIRKGILGVMSLASKLFWSMSVTSHSGGQGGGGASAVSTVSTSNSSSRSSQKSSRENSNLDNTTNSHNSKKQKQQPSGSQSSSQTSTTAPTYVNFNYKQDFANQKSKISGRYEAFERCKNRHDYTWYRRTGTYASHMQQPFCLFAFFF